MLSRAAAIFFIIVLSPQLHSLHQDKFFAQNHFVFILYNCIMYICQMHLRRTIILIAFLFSNIHAQQLVFENISDQLNLPSKECYNVMQDSRGYIWISTDAGLCRYNGNSTLIFGKNNGIPESSCYAVTEDAEGTIWIGTSGCRILTYKNNILSEAPFIKPIKDSLAPKNFFIHVIKSLPNHQLFFSTQNHHFLIDLPSGKFIHPDTVVSGSDLYFNKIGDQLLFINRAPHYKLFKNTKQGFMQLNMIIAGLSNNIRIPATTGNTPSWRIYTTLSKNGDMFIAFLNTLIRIDSKLQCQVYNTPNRIIDLYCDKTDGLWVGMYKRGALYYPCVSKSASSINILPDYSVSGVCEDMENGIWCTTLEKGIFYSRNKNLISYRNISGLEIKAEMLKCVDGKILVSSTPNAVLELSNNQWSKKEYNGMGRTWVIKDITTIQDICYTFGREFIRSTDANGAHHFLKFGETDSYSGAIQISQDGRGRVYILNASRNLHQIRDGRITERITETDTKGTCLYFYKRENKLLLGGHQGVFVVNQDNFQLTKLPGIEGTTTKIFELKTGQLCYLTKESGIYLQDKNKITRMDKVLQLPSSVFYDIAEDSCGHIWIATNQGLLKITNGPSPIIQVYTVLNGLPSTAVYNIAINDPYIFLSTDEGIVRFPIDQDLTNFTQPIIGLDQLKINGKDTTYSDNFILESDQNSMEITFYIPSYKDPGNTTFQYELKGTENKTEILQGNKLLLNKMPPGNYTLIVYAINSDGIRSRVPLTINFRINRPFWLKPLFIISVGIFLLSCIYFIIKLIAKAIQQKEQKKTELHQQLIEYRLNAIQAQMNPHFIFNAINSIQHYILNNDTQLAYDYLAKFSKLIRLVLSNSQHSIISLKKELETLELYIELEQKRFKNKFNYLIHVDKELEMEDIRIPVMLIQPFVENAIWHGIMNLDESKKGLLSVEVVHADSHTVKIIIKDNGIGRERSALMKANSNHMSMGTILSENRLGLLNEISHKKHTIVITDLYDENKNPLGTKVEIILPNE
jgi:ligand-binding sensor domain-containing protein